ncbi:MULTISPECIES: magnesium transporter CorA family protein [Porphyromonadaceae]|uniref:Magnesium transporter CorA n=1 Tax=Sanguibacteroides justesenii TaxID=1547597 RepID=A0A0C3R3W0_9PORP|nr:MULTISPECIES: magnesium transporter CorA family protein [Porphyromonadaceae]KIO43965.1 magnesium transporter CorA [Sanguibacteroides justesenii]KIO46533.1 magnesium transporter CorA [Sanguibacteroides justesenii]PXZ43999.1 magnesium transporter CorA family protein [Sanguibacteroides justesenii]
MRTFLMGNVGFEEKKAWEPKCWINVVSPTEEDIRFLTDKMGVPQSFFGDIEDIDERSRLEIEDEWILMILRIPYKVDESIPFITVPLGFIIKDDVIITVCHYKTEMIPDFIQYADRKGVEVKQPWDLVFRLFLSSSVWYLKYLKQINNQMHAAEIELEKSIRNEELQRLLKIEKSLVFFITSLRGNDNLLIKVKNLRSQRKYFDEDLVEDVEIEQRQAQDSARIYSDILSGTMDAYASVISNNLNIVMKRLTSISIILMLPTLIASLYGMNVPNSLENNPYGFLIVLVVSLLFSAIGFIVFKWRNWF